MFYFLGHSPKQGDPDIIDAKYYYPYYMDPPEKIHLFFEKNKLRGP